MQIQIELQSQLIELRQLVGELNQEYDRLSSDGQHILDNICDLISEIDVTKCNQEVFKDVVSSIDEGVSLKNQFPRVMADLPD